MKFDFGVSPKVFSSILNINIEQLSELSAKELRPILPCLVRMSLIAPVDITDLCTENRKAILTILSGIEIVNSIVALLSIDFHGLEVDVKQEQALRKKIGVAQSDSVLVQSLENGVALEFERSDSTRRLRLVLCELLYTGTQIQEYQKAGAEFFIKSSDLFDNAVYIPEVCDVINIALAELPALLSVYDITQILLHVKHGPDIICWIAANIPDYFNDICLSLIINSERIEDDNGGSRIRMATLTLLCRMNPTAAYFVRSKCVEMCKMAALTVTLTLEFSYCFWGSGGSAFLPRAGDIVSFVSGLLLGTDQHVRNWFTLFTRTRPKKNKENNAALQILREELIYQLKTMVKYTKDNYMPNSCVVYSSVLLKLYCALRGIAGIKFQDDEIVLLIKLMTVYVPATSEGVRLVSVAVCMLFACPSLISQPETDGKCVQWLKWLSGPESPFFGKPTDVTTAFSEMLLLLAIHLHGNQFTAVSELVCSTLGMKVSIRTHVSSRNRLIFVHEVFTEQVVTARAVKVLVTSNLSSNINGFLPIHCIHQLLKSRAFTKYKVNVKDWVYKQICASVIPLHPLLTPLIEVYVNSMLSISGKPNESISNEPISEAEIMSVFEKSSVLNIEKENENANLMPRLLLLYYVLLYEDVRLSNMQVFTSLNKNVKSYTMEFLSEFPIKYLLQQAQKDHQSYSGLFSALLRLLVLHFPHLALVDDWMDEEMTIDTVSYKPITETSLQQGLQLMVECPSQTSCLLYNLLTMPIMNLWRYVPTLVKYMRLTLDDGVPRYIQELYRRVWLRCNTLFPRSLWSITIEALLHEKATLPTIVPRQGKKIIDPLQILRCDYRVFRCSPMLSIVIRILQSSLAASRCQLVRHLLDRPFPINTAVNNPLPVGSLSNDVEREELKNALIAAQESTAIQILLEVCLETDEDRTSLAHFWSLREIRSLVCCYVHQTFIADPSLAKLVHFQCYSHDLLPVSVTGIPSMHICVDFIAELISQPSIEKQAFAVDLISHLSLQYALPHSMIVARLAVNTLTTLLTVLPTVTRLELFTLSVSPLVRICEAFPPLTEDVFYLLSQLGKICAADAALTTGITRKNRFQFRILESEYNPTLSSEQLYKEIINTFEKILLSVVLNRKIYLNYTGK